MTEPLDFSKFERMVRLVTEEALELMGAQGDLSKILDSVDSSAERISSAAPLAQLDTDLAGLIDHTLLKPDASSDQIRGICREAEQFGFATVCINPWYVPLAAVLLRGTKVKVCTVIGFPLGATLPQVKIYEAEESIKLGAQEIDMVINIGALKSGQYDAVESDVRSVVEASHRGRAICKVILETALLTAEEKVRASVICKKTKADFVKTSTGFGGAGATAADVALLRAVVSSGLGVKAAGGVGTHEDLKKMVSAGASRIGTSSGVKIMEQLSSQSISKSATEGPASEIST